MSSIITRLREAVSASTVPQLRRGHADQVRERNFSDKARTRMAAAGVAMPGGEFPIANRADLSNAIQAIGRAKDPAAAKAHIVKRAAALGASDVLPDDWKATTREADTLGSEARRDGDGDLDDGNTADMEPGDDDMGNMGECQACEGTGMLGGDECPRCDGTGNAPKSGGGVEDKTPLTESLRGVLNLREADLTRTANAYEVVVIREGLGNPQDSHYYTKEALREAVAKGLFTGLPAYGNHPTRSEERDQPERDIRKLVGHYRNARYREADGVGEVVADLVPLKGDAYRWVGDLLESTLAAQKDGAQLVGISIDGGGMVEAGPPPNPALAAGRAQVNLVREVIVLPSADLVTRPGAGGRIVRRLQESLRGSGASRPSDVNPSRKETKMKASDLQDKVRDATAKLRESVMRETSDDAAREAAGKDAKAALDSLDELGKAEVEAEVKLREVEPGEESVPVTKLREVEAERDEAKKELATTNRTLLAARVLREAKIGEDLQKLYLPEMVKDCSDEDGMKAYLEREALREKAIRESVLGSIAPHVEGSQARVLVTAGGGDGTEFLAEHGIPMLPKPDAGSDSE